MKRKFTYLFLVVAMSVAALGSFVSCKDYEEDILFQQRIADARLASNIADLQTYLNQLQGDMQACCLAVSNRITNDSLALEALKTWIGYDPDLYPGLSTILGDLAALQQAYGGQTIDQLLNWTINNIGVIEGDKSIAEILAELQAGTNIVIGEGDDAVNLADFILSLQEQLDQLNQLGGGGQATLVDIINDIYATIGNLQPDQNLAELIAELQNQVNALSSRDTTIIAAIELIEAKIGDLGDDKSIIELIERAQFVADSTARELTEANNTIIKLNSQLQTLQEWKDNNTFVTEEQLRDSVNVINTTINNLTTTVQTIADSLLVTTKFAKDALELAQNNSGLISSLESTVSGMQTTISKIETRLETFATKTELEEVRQQAIAANALAESDSIRIDNLSKVLEQTKEDLQNLTTTVTTQGLRIDSVVTRITELETKADSLAQAITEAKEEAAANLQAAKEEIQAVTDSLGREIGYLDTRVTNVEEKLATAIDSIRILTNDVASLKDRLADVEEAVQEIPGMKEDIEKLKEDVAKNTEDIQTLDEKVTALTGKLDNLINRLNQMITSIVVQGVVNPIYGTFNTPFGLTSNVLCAYYGKATSDGIEFPTSDVSLYYKGNQSIEVLTDEDVDIFYNSGQSGYTAAQNQTLFDDVQGNAGKLYMTVNPASKDVSGTKFTLVNSRDEESPIELSTLRASNDLMVFGLGTRAGNGNGFYVADATINKNFYQAAPTVNLTKADLKAAYDNLRAAAQAAKGGTSNIRTVAENVMKSAANLSGVVTSYIPAYGIKAPWQYTDENDNVISDAVYSKYEIAAIAVDPLSFATVNALDSKIHGVPGLGTIESMIHRFANTVKGQLPKKLADEFGVEKFDTARIQTINLKNISFDDFVISIKVDDKFPIDIEEVVMNNVDVLIPWDAIEELYFSYDTQVYDETTGEIKDSTIVQHIQHPATEGIPATISEVRFDPEEQDIYIKFTYTDEDMTKALQDKFKEMKASLEGINPMLEYLKGYLDSVNSLIDRVNDYDLGQYVDKLEDKILDYVHKFAEILEPYMKPSDWLQPFLIVSDGTKVYPLTGSATVSNGQLTFIATSRTAELLAPSFKKWVAVTDVIKGDKSAKKGDAALKAVRDKANSSNSEFNTILRGVTRAINANLQSGYTYEISYQALDYSGKVSAKKYLVTVK